MTGDESRAADLTLEDIRVGDSFTVERCFDAADIDRFAALSGDFSPLHMSSDYARTSQFGERVVHGILLASLFSQLVGMRVPGRRALYLSQDLTFRRPVLVGEPVVASAKVTAVSTVTEIVQLATEIRRADGTVAVSGSAKVKVRDGTRPAPSRAAPASRTTTTAGERPVALVIGGSRGIGAAIVRRLAAAGYGVAIGYLRNHDAAHRVAAQVKEAGGTAMTVSADVRDEAAVTAVAGEVAVAFGGVDVLVNGATATLESRPLSEMSWSSFEEHLHHQVKGVLNACQAARSFLARSGRGSIVNILSQVVTGPPPAGMADYVVAKHALLGLSKALAAEWAAEGIRVNAVSPGLMETDLTSHYRNQVFRMEAARTPMKRLATAEDVAGVVAYLCSDEAAYLTGANIFITGGQVML